jgi:D-glycero-D-manno-heptose 1,7-bisphosphate phosphatase
MVKIKKSIAVFLDRDGVLSRTNVINGKSYAPRTISEFKLLPGVKKSVDKLKEVGYLVIVVTNQPDIGNGLINENIVEMMHKKLSKKTNITKIYVCPHKQQENCVCRKPNPGMLLEAAFEYGIDLGKSFMVGD